MSTDLACRHRASPLVNYQLKEISNSQSSNKRLVTTPHNATRAHETLSRNAPKRRKKKTENYSGCWTECTQKYSTFSLPVAFHVQTSSEAKRAPENPRRRVRNGMGKTTSKMDSPDKRRNEDYTNALDSEEEYLYSWVQNIYKRKLKRKI